MMVLDSDEGKEKAIAGGGGVGTQRPVRLKTTQVLPGNYGRVRAYQLCGRQQELPLDLRSFVSLSYWMYFHNI
jgi:hypothetical protein